MNIARLALAAIAGLVVEICYGFVVYGLLLSGEFAKFPALYRSAETGPGYLPLMFAGVLVAIVAASIIYAKGYEGGSGVQEGMRFGALVGLVMVGYVAGVNYAIMNIGKRLAVYYGLAALVEWVAIGIVIGFVYSPRAKVRAAGAGV